MKILLLTDIHFGKNTCYPKFEGDTTVQNFGERFPEYVDNLKKVAQDCDLVVNLGDLMQQTKSVEEDRALYKQAVELLEFGKPIRHVIGNHDIVNLKREDINEVLGIPRSYYSFDFQGYHCVVLDGNREGKSFPESFQFDLEQIEWLKNDLAQAHLPTLVFCHFPLVAYDLSENPIFSVLGSDMAFPQEWERVKVVLDNSGKVLATFSGHMHYAHEQVINGLVHYCIGSFTANNGHDVPTTEYAIAHVGDNKVSLERAMIEPARENGSFGIQ